MAVFFKNAIFATYEGILASIKTFCPSIQEVFGTIGFVQCPLGDIEHFLVAALIPILQILFQVDGGIRANDYMTWMATGAPSRR